MALLKIQPVASGDIYIVDSAATILKSDGTNFTSFTTNSSTFALTSTSVVEIVDADAANVLTTATLTAS